MAGSTALSQYIKKNGRAPNLSLVIKPLDGRPNITISKFLSYHFTSSILIPVDSFQFSFALPSTDDAIDDYVVEGDVAFLVANNTTICTGIIDTITVETTEGEGDIVTVIGRNLLGQLEDQNAINVQNKPMWGDDCPLLTAVGSVIQYTRIRGLGNQNAPSVNLTFATEPGESKMSALMRFIEPLNCLVWSNPEGYLIVGRPNFGQTPLGTLVCDRGARNSNVNSIKVTYAATQIPNIIVAVWSGQESVVAHLPKQAVNNTADGPFRLLTAGHKVQKAVVISTPDGNDAQSLSDQNAFKVYGSTILEAYAQREIARSNIAEIQVQANVKSHFNDDLTPFLIDQVYFVNYPRASVNEAMYVYQVDYTCDAKSGPKTSISLCRRGCIVAGASQSAVTATLTPASLLPNL